jgi:DNA-binding SARP family transcriptional activator/tetratricopeptide (TPR) repeat protein
VAGRPVTVRGPQRRAVLIALLLDANRTVTIGRLHEAMWDDDPPNNASHILSTNISGLRGLLGPDGASVLSRQSGGYLLTVDEDQIDANLARELLAHARAALETGDPAAAIPFLTRARSLWRGEPLADVADRRFAEPEVVRLRELGLAVAKARARADLALARHGEIIGDLRGLVFAHPLDEELREDLVLAYYRSGRPEEASATCREGLAALVDAGLDTSRLERLEHRVLNAAPDLAAPEPVLPQPVSLHPVTPEPVTPEPGLNPPAGPPERDATRGTGVGRPAGRDRLLAVTAQVAGPARTTRPGNLSLPPDIATFTGRDLTTAGMVRELSSSAALAAGDLAAGGIAAGGIVVPVAGKAGSGKTALAVHVAHLVSRVFADQALFIDLRGTQPEPMPAELALRRLLRALEGTGVPGVGGSGTVEPAGGPAADRDELTARYQAALAGRRVLVVLDNAASEAQIRPLLPARPGCAAIVTSRVRLHEFTRRYWTTDVLIASDAIELLGKIIGPGRVEAEADAARDVVGMCGYLPMAIVIAGRRIHTHPHWRLGWVAERLADERHRLAWFTAGDLEIRASFALSYDGRPADEQRAFRLLSQPDLADFTPWAAAACLGTHRADAEDVIDGLADYQLIEQAGTDATGAPRYRFHDLLRAYARERFEAAPDGPNSAGPNSDGAGSDGAGSDGPSSDTGVGPAERAAALRRLAEAYLARLRAARAALLPSRPPAEPAGATGSPDATISPASPASPDATDPSALGGRPLVWFDGERHNLLALTEQLAGEGFTTPVWELADAVGALYAFGGIHGGHGGHWDDWERALELGRAAAHTAGDAHAQARMLLGLADRDILLGFEEAFWRLDAPGAEPRDSPATATHPASHTRGRFELAAHRLRRARATFEAAGDELGAARARHGLADSARGLGRFAEAQEHFTAALEAFRRHHDPSAEAETLICRAACHADQRDPGPARDSLTMAETIARDTGSRPLLAYTLRRMGDVHRELGHPDLALDAYRRALPLLADLPDPLWHPRVLVRQGDVQAQLGDLDAARASWTTATEALRAAGSPELGPAQDRLVAPAQPTPTPLGAERVTAGFDPAAFIARARASERIVRVLNTWTDLLTEPHADAFADAVAAATGRGAIVRILLLSPDSHGAQRRSEDLRHPEDSRRPEDPRRPEDLRAQGVDVPALIRDNLRRLAALTDTLPPPLRARLAVRLCAEASFAYHRWDDGALVSMFPLGHTASAGTQHQTHPDSSLTRFAEQTFDELWRRDDTIDLAGYLRIPLRVQLDGRAWGTISAAYTTVAGAVHVQSPELDALLAAREDDQVSVSGAADARHPLAGLGPCLVLPLRPPAPEVTAAFRLKYAAEPGEILWLHEQRRPRPGPP